MRPRIVAPLIRVDDAGDGHFGAPRGDRTHRGVDYLCRPGDTVHSPCNGVVSKLGFPYADDSTWRYVEITDGRSRRHRLFYVEPLHHVGTIVKEGNVIGHAQDISLRYSPRMKPHLHYEIISFPAGEYLNVEEL